jgi:hypothetical protein
MGWMKNRELTPRPSAGRTRGELSACVVVCLLASGCNDQRAPVVLHPVKGKVTVNGRPAEGVYLQFHALDSREGSFAPEGGKTEADGSFTVPVHQGGEYLVTAFWPTVTVVEGEPIEGADRFDGYYRDLRRPASKVAIRQGGNSLPPINLQMR